MSGISLESSIRTCKVDTAYANKMYSDRFLNPNTMVCPIWNGFDSTGRRVCRDSFVTKAAGCNSATDRVNVENAVSRPQYVEYLPLDVAGIKGNIYGQQADGRDAREDIRSVNKVTGNFGIQFASNIEPKCREYPYERAMAQESQRRRYRQGEDSAYSMLPYKTLGGY